MSTAILLGLAVGLRHAVDPDHVVAVSSIAAREGRPWRASWVGVSWGLAHGTTILCLGLSVVALQIAVPDGLTQLAEWGVGVLLLALGASNLAALSQTATGDGARPLPARSLRAALARSGLVGLVHGMAGSGAVTVLAATALPTPTAALLYLGAFGVGTIAGMVACSTLVGAPFALLGGAPRLQRAMTAITGAASLALGIYLLLDHTLRATSTGAA